MPFGRDVKLNFEMDSRHLAAAIDILCQIKYLGQERYDTYVSEKLVNRTKTIADPGAKNCCVSGNTKTN